MSHLRLTWAGFEPADQRDHAGDYALGTLTMALSLIVIGLSLTALCWLRPRQASRGSDAAKGMV